MDVFMLMEYHRERWREMPSVLVSGEDAMTKEVITAKWLGMLAQDGAVPHLVLDMSRIGEFRSILQKNRLNIAAMIPGNNSISIFNGDAVDTEDRLRQMMRGGGWSEEKINKGIIYLEFLYHMDTIGRKDQLKQGIINLQLIRKYSSAKEVENTINQMIRNHIISYREGMNLIGRYSELSPVAPEIENLIIGTAVSLSLTAEKNIDFNNLAGNSVVYVHLGRVKDEFMRRIILQNVAGMIEDYAVRKGRKPAVTIWTRGKSEDTVLSEFIETVEELSQIYFCTNNFFAIESWRQIEQIFRLGIYSKHASSHACECLEQLFGNIYVRKKTYAVAEDMSKGLLDKILRMNIIKTESLTEPQAEAKYRKEDIMCFPSGYGIINYDGQNVMMHICS